MITRDDWLKAIAETMPPPPVDDAITVKEFAEMADCTLHAARKKLLQMVTLGTAKMVKKRQAGSDGRQMRITAFQLIKQTKKK